MRRGVLDSPTFPLSTECSASELTARSISAGGNACFPDKNRTKQRTHANAIAAAISTLPGCHKTECLAAGKNSRPKKARSSVRCASIHADASPLKRFRHDLANSYSLVSHVTSFDINEAKV